MTEFQIHLLEPPEGYRVDTMEKYWRLIKSICDETLELVEINPDRVVWVTFPIEEDE